MRCSRSVRRRVTALHRWTLGVLVAGVFVAGLPPAGASTWVRIADTPAYLVGVAAASANGRVYAMGGWNFDVPGYSAQTLAYNPSSDTWTQVASMPAPREGLAAVTGPEGKIYALGGRDGNGPSNAMFVFDPASSSWTTGTAMGQLRFRGAAAAVGGRIYAAGGGDGTPSDPGSRKAEVYDLASRLWSFVADMPDSRTGAAAAAGPDGRLYVIGGSKGGVAQSSVWAYEPSSNTWTWVAPLPVARALHGAVTGADGKIYVLGGTDAAGDRTATVVAYDVGANSWSQVPSMLVAREYFAAALGPDNRIYAAGDERVAEAFQTQAPGGGGGGGGCAAGPAAQCWSVNVSGASAGELSVSLDQASGSFGDIAAGGSAGQIPVGTIRYTNTLANGQAWSASVAATSLVDGSGSVVPFSGMRFTPGQGLSPSGPAPGAASNFAGPDANPGTTYSSPVTLMTAAGTDQGQFVHDGSTVTIFVPASAAQGTHSGTLQYTITG